MTITHGWCDTHPGNDHMLSPTCVDFVSDTDHTAALIREANARDSRTSATWPSGARTVEAAYVAEHRPY